MKWLRVALIVCFFALLQAGLVNALGVTSLNIKPDLLLVLLVFFAVFSTPRDAIITSFAIGFAADLIAVGLPMGPRTISFGIIGTLAAHINSVLAVRKISHRAVAVFLCGLVAGVLCHFLTSVISHSAIPHAYVIIVGTSLYSSAISPFLFLSCDWLMRIKTNRSGR